MAKKFYAVAFGRKNGIYGTWDECQQQVKGFKNARFKGFTTKLEAETFIQKNAPKQEQEQQDEPPNKRQKGVHVVEQPPSKRQKVVLASKTKIWFHINFDGGSRGNPGLSGAGAEVITRRIFSKEEESKGVVKRTKAQIRKYLGNAQTNNQAEYEGAISGLEHARKVLVDLLGEEEQEPPHVTLVLQGDSNLIIEQLNGNYKCNSPKLQPLYKKAKKIIADIEKSAATMDATYEHVYRRYNATADALANEAMNAQRSWTTTSIDDDGDDEGGSLPPPVST